MEEQYSGVEKSVDLAMYVQPSPLIVTLVIVTSRSIDIFESEEAAARNILRFGHAMKIQGLSFAYKVQR